MNRMIARPLVVALVTVAALAATTRTIKAQHEQHSSRPHGHAPIGAMGSHIHEKGRFSLSYRFVLMSMEGNRNGTERIEVAEVQKTFTTVPVDMTMGMHMAGFMYAPSDAVTLLTMAHWTDNEMNVRLHHGSDFESASAGLGDATVGALVGLKRTGPTRVHLNAGVSLPLGSIEQVGTTPMSMEQEVQLPYPMQLGSGTWDLQPGVTVLGMRPAVSWGLQATGIVRLGENGRGYRQGHAADATAWFAYRPAESLSLSTRLLWKLWGDYAGRDKAYGNRAMAPTVREDLRGGRRIDVPVGVNYHFSSGALRGHRIAAEWHITVYQSLNGPQLETDWLFTAGWQKSFDPF